MNNLDIAVDLPQDLTQEILDSVKNIDTKIEIISIPYGNLLVKRFVHEARVRQIIPGQTELGEQIVIPSKALSYNLDLSGGNSETLLTNIVLRIRMALANLSFKHATFVLYGKPRYQGKGIYAVQYGLVVEV